MSIPLVYTKAALLEKLKAELQKAKRADALALAKHRKDEERHLQRFRQALRDALKWSYAQAKKKGFSPDVGYGPYCPASRETHLRNLISQVAASQQRRYTINQHGKYGPLYRVLAVEPKSTSLC